MTEKETTTREDALCDSKAKPDRIYQIACLFPALKRKGALKGTIPGVRPDGFYDTELHDFLYKGNGGMLSTGEFLLLEFLLNLYNPDEYKGFNFGRAVNLLDDRHLLAMLHGVAGIVNGNY